MKKALKGSGFFRSLSYMTASAALFAVSFVLTAVLLVRAVRSAGGLGTAEGLLGIAALVAAAAGFVIPLYGHFIVREDGRADWRIGCALNGLMLLVLVWLYFLGIR